MSDFRYLVFGGGGAAGYAYVGALEQLAEESKFSIDEIHAIAGSSVGALAALIVSLNYPLKDSSTILSKLNLKDLADGGCYTSRIYRLFTQYGIYQGQAFANFVHKIIQERTGRSDPENVTFADLKQMGFKDLYIVATKLYRVNGQATGKQKIFSFAKTPNTPVAAAIRASAAAPIFFSRVRLKKLAKGTYVLDNSGDLYDDGGVLNNYPIEIFDQPQFMLTPTTNDCPPTNAKTLGLALHSLTKITNPQKTPINDATPIIFAEGLVNSMLHQINNTKLELEKNKQRTILIDRKNVKLDDFDMDDETKRQLIESGKQAVKLYFANHKFDYVNDQIIEEVNESKPRLTAA